MKNISKQLYFDIIENMKLGLSFYDSVDIELYQKIHNNYLDIGYPHINFLKLRIRFDRNIERYI